MRLIALLTGVVLLASACAPSPDVDTAARMARLEERVARLEAARVDDGAVAQADVALSDSEKAAFAASADEDSLKEQLALDADAEIRFDEETDTLLVRAGSGEQADLDTAWAAAQQLAELWGGLQAYQPVLDLEVGDVRCACSARLMKGVQAGVADRQVWEGACGRV